MIHIPACMFEMMFLCESGDLEVRFLTFSLSLSLILAPNCHTQEGLPLEFLTGIQEDRSSWKGSATVPLEYLPPGLRGFNAYAIHGTGEQREYQALYPAEGGKHDQPDL